jgi:hypothetical protein
VKVESKLKLQKLKVKLKLQKLKVESKLKLQKLKVESKLNTVPLGGCRVGACSPIDFINEITKLFFGMTCDHSLGGSQVFTKFYKCLLKKGVLSGVSDAPNPPKTNIVSSHLLANLHKTTNKQ